MNAAAAVCNLVLEFSPVKDAMLKAEALKHLAPLAGSMLSELRLNAVWALKNLVHECDDSARGGLTHELPWACMRSLLQDCEPAVQDQAVCLLMNLCKAEDTGIQQVSCWRSEHVGPVLAVMTMCFLCVEYVLQRVRSQGRTSCLCGS